MEDFLGDIETPSAKEGSWVVTMLPASGANEPELIKKHVEPEAGNELDPEPKVKGIAYEGHTI